MKVQETSASFCEAYWNRQIMTAEAIARQAHEGQTDKGGHPYIEHPRAVARQISDPHAKTAALLHDVIEDTNWGASDLLKAGIDPAVVDTVTVLTRQAGESYQVYLERVRKDPKARMVKLADLAHNSQIERIPHPTKSDFRRLEKYRQAQMFLCEETGDSEN